MACFCTSVGCQIRTMEGLWVHVRLAFSRCLRCCPRCSRLPMHMLDCNLCFPKYAKSSCCVSLDPTWINFVVNTTQLHHITSCFRLSSSGFFSLPLFRIVWPSLSAFVLSWTLLLRLWLIRLERKLSASSRSDVVMTL